MTASPKVSVIIPAYNATATLQRCVESVCRQTLADLEIIIINDASTDDTSKLAHELATEDARIRVVGLVKNIRQSAGRNLGFEHAKGEWLAILDADDAYDPERLKTLIAHAEARELDMVADNQFFFDAGLGRVSRLAQVMKQPVQTWTLLRHLQEERIGKRFKWGLLKPVLRSAFLKSVSVAYRPEFHMGEDSLFYMELLASGAKAEVIDTPLYIYTTSRGEISGAASHSTSHYKFEEHYATYLCFEKLYKDRMNTAEYAALKKAMAAAVASYQAFLLKSDARRARLPSMFVRVVQYPSLLYFIGQSAWKFARHRLGFKITKIVRACSARVFSETKPLRSR